MKTERANVNTHNGTLRGIHAVAKPIGPLCNLNCEYCFYLEKRALFGEGEKFRMTDDVLSAFIANYIETQPTPIVEFVWQGGEPTLLGVGFYKRVIELQRPYARRKTIKNSLQTNGTLLTDEWCRFLKQYGFLVGISLDGPKDVHDRYRRDRSGNGTFDRVMRGLRLLQRHGVEYNVLASVARDTAAHPLDVYRFLRGEGVGFIQFAPIVERMPDARSRRLGPRLAGPEGGVALVYIKQGADFSKYNEVMFDQVVFYLKKDAKYKNIQPEQMKQLADEFARAAAKAMQGAYPVVGEPGPDVLRVRVAITDIEPGNPVRSGMTTVLPIGLAVSIIQKGATGKYPGVGSASMEAEFLDSLTNERLAAAIDKRAGSKFSGFSKFASAKEAFDFWSKRLRIFLDKAHGRTR